MRLSRRRKERTSKPPLRLRRVVRRIGDGFRYDWPVLLLGGLAVFLPIDLIGAFDLIGPLESEDLDASLVIADTAALLFAQILLPMIGSVLYAGIIAAGEEERRLGERRGFLSIARSLPYFTLIVADVLLVLASILGFLLLILPGVVVMVMASLIAPVIELERAGPIRCFKRSARLVKPYFWKVAGLVIPATLLQAVLGQLGDELGHGIFGSGFAGDWIGSVAMSLLSSPVWALTVLALYLEIVGLEGKRKNAELRLPGRSV